MIIDVDETGIDNYGSLAKLWKRDVISFGRSHKFCSESKYVSRIDSNSIHEIHPGSCEGNCSR